MSDPRSILHEIRQELQILKDKGTNEFTGKGKHKKAFG